MNVVSNIYLSIYCLSYYGSVCTPLGNKIEPLGELWEREGFVKKAEYFTRFPNHYLRGNIKETFGVSRKFYITYILIDKYRSYENYSWITIHKILDFYGYKNYKHKQKVFQEILDVLEYMVAQKMISIQQDFSSIGYDTGIEIKIIPENFDAQSNFSKISSSQLEAIVQSEASSKRENLLLIFLYISSHIYRRPRDANGNELLERPYERPEAFWKCVTTMAKELGMAKNTIIQCMNHLTQGTHDYPPLLVKHQVGNAPSTSATTPKAIPNIYVLNKAGYEQEIEWALQKLKHTYYSIGSDTSTQLDKT